MVSGGVAWRKSQEFGFEDLKFQTENYSLDLVIWRIGRGKTELASVTAFFFFFFEEFCCKGEQRNARAVGRKIFERITFR